MIAVHMTQQTFGSILRAQQLSLARELFKLEAAGHDAPWRVAPASPGGGTGTGFQFFVNASMIFECHDRGHAFVIWLPVYIHT